MADLTSIEAIVSSRVLIVEDDRTRSNSSRRSSNRKQMFEDVARDAGQARAAFHMHPPDIVLVDAMLPNEVSGFELIERLKQENIHNPVIHAHRNRYGRRARPRKTCWSGRLPHQAV